MDCVLALLGPFDAFLAEGGVSILLAEEQLEESALPGLLNCLKKFLASEDK